MPSLLEILILTLYSLLRSNSHNQSPLTSLLSRHSQCESLSLHLTKKDERLEQSLVSNEVRIKGLEPPRLSASDPKSDVATNYTISAGSCIGTLSLSVVLRCKVKKTFRIYATIGQNNFIFCIFVYSLGVCLPVFGAPAVEN